MVFFHILIAVAEVAAGVAGTAAAVKKLSKMVK